MYSEEQMDQLANALEMVVTDVSGNWRDKAAFIRESMEERDVSHLLDEFCGWFNE